MEQLERRELLSVSLPLKLDFGPTTSPVASGYVGESVVAYTAAQGYGWESTSGLWARNRGGDPLTGDLIKGHSATFLVDVPNGTYDVTPILGDPSYVTTDNIYINGTLEAGALSVAKGQILEPTYTVQVTNGQLRFHISGSSTTAFGIDGLIVAPHAAPSVTNVSPADAATEVSTATTATVTFSEAMNAATVNATTVQLQDSSGKAVAATVSYDATTHVATLAPSSALATAATYTVFVQGGSSGVMDTVGRGMAANFTSSFTTDPPAPPPTPPTANAGPTESGNEGSAVKFAGTASGGQGTLTYQWNFGDGGTTSGTLTPSHTFADNGTYTVTLTVTDGSGSSSKSTTTATISNVAPTATINGPYTTTVNTALALGATVTDPSTVDTTKGFTYSWDFGDSSAVSALSAPSHTYAATGTYTVTLTVTDKDGGKGTATTTVTVNAVSLPTANAGAAVSGNEGSAVKFAGSASGGQGALTYKWDFGDGGTTSGTLTPSHTFADNGTYTVTLTVTDASGNSSKSTTTATISNVAPTATINGPYTTTVSTAVAFTATVTDPSTTDTTKGFTYSWSFGDNSAASTASAPSHSYSATGTYTVTLTVTDKDGGKGTATTTVTVNAASSGHTYYVATTGNDNNGGSLASPFQTLQHGVSVLQPGDTLKVEAGSYAGFIVGWDPAGQGQYGVIAGTASAPITIEADPAAKAGSVIINQRNNETASGIDLEPGCDYITINGFTIQGGVNGSNGIGASPTKGSGIKVTGNNDIVSNNTISNVNYGFGILADNANNVQLLNNNISGTGSQGNADYGHGIYLSGTLDGAVVRGNVVHDNDYIGIHINGDISEGGTGLVTNALIENNKIYNNGQNGINADGVQKSTIRNNLIYGYAGYGICLYQIDAGGPSTNNIIVNNTIYSTKSGSGAAVRILNGGTGNTIYNNILLGGDGTSIRISNDSLSGLVSDYNVVTSNPYQSEDDSSTQTLAQWQSAHGQDKHSLVSTAALLFVNASGGDYHLLSSSPAIGKGTSTDAPGTDLDGKTRPSGAIDIGAYQF